MSVDCSFMVIRRIRVWQLYFTFELITSKSWKMNKIIIIIIKDIFNLKTLKQSLKNT